MMVQKQLNHNEVEQNESRFPIYVVCDSIRSPENAGMIFRVSEAFGVRKIIFSDQSPKSNNPRVKRAARSTQQFIASEYTPKVKDVLLTLKNNGFSIIGLEITDASKVINEIDFISYDKIVIVVGAEKTGISSELLKLIDISVHIPMFGTNSSMNVVNALAIALYEIRKQVK